MYFYAWHPCVNMVKIQNSSTPYLGVDCAAAPSQQPGTGELDAQGRQPSCGAPCQGLSMLIPALAQDCVEDAQ
jgi:hypothetical protein